MAGSGTALVVMKPCFALPKTINAAKTTIRISSQFILYIRKDYPYP